MLPLAPGQLRRSHTVGLLQGFGATDYGERIIETGQIGR